jgi:serine protease
MIALAPVLVAAAPAAAASPTSAASAAAAASAASPAATASAASAASPQTSPTGNLLVLLDRGRAEATAGNAAVHATIASAGARIAGFAVPQIGLITVRPSRHQTAASLAQRLRRLPGVASVQPEHRLVPRSVPNDPALTAPDSNSGVVEWVLAREGFYNAWSISRGDGAEVGVIDTGIDASHPDLASKIAAAVDQQDPSDARGTAGTDEVGHGTHVSSLACADTGNGIGIAGAGYDCKLVIEKSDFSDSSIAAAIVDATDRHVQAINMSFGPGGSSTPAPAPQSEVRALDYAAAHKVVLVAAAGDSPGTEQGDPANVVQPAGTGPTLSAGIGLDVTAAAYNGARASFAGYGSEISIAAFGALNPDAGGLVGLSAPPPGILGAFPANSTDLEQLPNPCFCRTTFDGDSRYAYLQGTSMAAPQVAAVGAMMRVLNPFASLADVLTTIKRTAQRPAGTGWTSSLGWGILDAGTALEAIRRIDRLAPSSKLVAPRVARRRAFVLRWSGRDRQYPGLIASGIARYDVYARARGRRAVLIARTMRHRLTFHGRRGYRYVFFTVAVDHAGNREVHPVDVTTRVARGAS